MKTLIIENQYQKDPEIDGLIKDHPDLFSDVTVITGALHRPPEQLIEEVKTHDALIISSTFMYKDQLEDMTELLTQIEPKDIYVRNLSNKIIEWTDEDRHIHFHTGFMDDLESCINKHRVFSFKEDWEDRSIKDEVWEKMRWPAATGRGKFIIQKIDSL